MTHTRIMNTYAIQISQYTCVRIWRYELDIGGASKKFCQRKLQTSFQCPSLYLNGFGLIDFASVQLILKTFRA